MASCVACFEVLVASNTCKEKEDGMTRAIFLATAALLAMLILAPMAFTQDSTVAQDSTMIDGKTFLFSVGDGGILETTVVDGIPAGGPAPTPTTGGPAILLPAVALLLGSGILTYAILRRR